MDSPGEILRLCRLCLVKDQVNIPIFEADGDSREIFLKISSCLPVKVSREDRLPKKICDGCSEKLNSFYEFWSSSANAEKTLLSWVGEEDVEEKKEPAVSKSLATLVKEESEPVDEAPAESIEESTKDEAEAPPAKRARRSAAVKAQINLAPDSEDDDLDMGEPLTKTEEESAESDGEDKDPSYTDMPGTSADDEQAGPSGMGKDGVEAPFLKRTSSKTNMENVRLRLRSTRRRKDLNCLVNEAIKQAKKRGGNKSGLCPECGKVVPNLTNHLRDHKSVFTCDRCFVNFKTEKLLQEHREVHDEENPHKCDQCTLIFKNVTKLALHRFTHTGGYECPICGFVATSKFRNSIIAHIKRHEDNYAVRCDICNKGFLCKKKLEEHLEWHDNVPKYECQICHKRFPVKSYLTLHNKFNHKKELFGTEEIFQCEICGRKFTFEKSFKRHLSCIHRIGKDFTVKCPVCDKVIANNHNLKKHMKVHTGEKDYSCHVCGKTFSQKQYVSRHQRVHQTDKEEEKKELITIDSVECKVE